MEKVFIVDDEVWMRKGIRSILETSGLEVEIVGEAEDSIEALEMSKNIKPDIFLVDIRMPRMDGISFIIEASKICSESKFIIISGCDDFNYARRAVSLNVVDYVLKPIDKDAIIKPILKAISMLKAERENKTNLIETSLQIKEKFFKQILDQDIDNENIPDMLGGEIDNYCYVCVTIKILNSEILAKDKVEYSLVMFVLNNLIQDLVPTQNHAIHYLNAEGVITVLLLNNKFKPKEIHHIKENLCTVVLDIVKRLNFFSVMIASSSVHEGISSIKLCYDEAITSIKKKILFVEDRKVDKCKDSNYPIEKEKQLISSIYLNDKHEINIIVVEMINDMVNYNYDVEKFEKMMELMWFIGEKIIIEKSIDKNDVEQSEDMKKKLIYYDNLDHIATTMSAYFVNISNAVVNNGFTSGKMAIKDLKKYIDIHFSEDITLMQLAKTAHMNPTYLSDIFKDNTGMNFLDYLTNQRVQKACEYLKKYRLPINQISTLVGYENERYFSTVFKKVTGITPKEYRKKSGEVT